MMSGIAKNARPFERSGALALPSVLRLYFLFHSTDVGRDTRGMLFGESFGEGGVIACHGDRLSSVKERAREPTNLKAEQMR
jgi:hypothetical protein